MKLKKAIPFDPESDLNIEMVIIGNKLKHMIFRPQQLIDATS